MIARTLLAASCALALAPANGAAQCPAGTPPPCRPRPATAPATNVAVLYFSVRSADPGDSALADGLTEAITDELGSDQRLHVSSVFAVRRFRGTALGDPASLGRTLGAGTLVTGVVQRAQSQLLVRVELLAAATGQQLWRAPFQGLGSDPLQLQREIAQRVAASIGGELAGGHAAAQPDLTRDTAAYSAYLRGNGLLPQRTLRTSLRAIAEYERAVALDPRMASAWARMAIVYANRLEFLDPVGAHQPDTLVAAGMRAADRALALAPNSGEAWVAKAYLLRFQNPRTADGVDAAFERAKELSPRSGETWAQYGDYVATTRRPGYRPDQYIAALRRALEFDPARVSIFNLATGVGGAEGLTLADSGIALMPTYPNGYEARALLLLRVRGDTAGALRDLASAAAFYRADGRSDWDARMHRARLARDTAAERSIILAAVDEGLAEPALSETEGNQLAQHVLETLGDREKTIGVFQRVRPRGIKLYHALAAEWARTLRDDPRIRALLDESRPPWETQP